MMQIIGSGNVDASTRHAATIYFKNWIKRSWDESKNESEKAEIRKNYLPLIVHSPHQIQTQLTTGLHNILHNDYPEKWPNALEEIDGYLKHQDQAVVGCGLLALYELVNVFKWKTKDNRVPLTRAIRVSFGRMAEIATQLLKLDPAVPESQHGALMLKTIFKTYHSAIVYELPKALQEQQALILWCTLFAQAIEKPFPEQWNSKDNDELRQMGWWKAKKWAYRSLYRLSSRYGNPALETFSDSSFKAFAKVFMDQFAPAMLKMVMGQTEKLIAGQTMPSRVSHLLLSFLVDGIKHKVTWNLMKPHTEILVTRLIFPMLCFTEADQELWEDDPNEFIQKKLDPMQDYSSPVAAAHNLLIDMVTERFKTTFFPVLQFINQILSTSKDPSQLDGALSMLSDMAGAIMSKKSSVKSQVGSVLSQFVLPHMQSASPFLRMRACNVIQTFCDTDSGDDIVLDGFGEDPLAGWTVVFERAVNLMAPQESIPVRVYAALLLERLISRDGLRDRVAPHVGLMMQSLLQITRDIDLEVLTVVMERLVEVYPAEVAPFSIELCASLRDTFLKLMSEYQSLIAEDTAEATETDFFADNGTTDKLMTAMGLVKTMATLILTVQTTKSTQSSPSKKQPIDYNSTQQQLLSQMEATVLPCIVFVLQNKLEDMYDEMFEMFDCLQYQQERISPALWQVFELIYTLFKNGGFDFMEELFPVLDNYISYGKSDIAQRQDLQDKFADMIQSLLVQREDSDSAIMSFKLMESMLMHLRVSVDRFVPVFLQLAFERMANTKPTSLHVHCLEVVVNCIWYNPLMTLTLLNQAGKTQEFFALWLGSTSKLTRVHDKKLSVVALLTLFQESAKHWDQIGDLKQGYGQLMKLMLDLLATLPKAEQERKELEEMYGGGVSDDDDDEFDVNDQSDNEDEFEEDFSGELLEDDEDVPDEEAEYLNYLNGHANGAGAEDDSSEDGWEEELGEELYFESPLDDVNVYQQFQHTMAQLAQQPIYAVLTSQLTPQDQQVANEVIQKAQESQ